MLETLRTARGVMRSLGIYYGWHQRRRSSAMDALYRRFVKRGDLVFDIGAHVGDRVAAFRRLGAKVVAVEPQPALASTLTMLYGHSSNVVIERAAVGRKAGDVRLMVNTDNPTISTASNAFIHAAQDAPGWQDQHWDKSIRVPMTTLDVLIEQHGRPAFIKIDVEGFEEAVLQGARASLARFRPGLLFESGLESAEQRKSIHDLLSDYEPIGAAVPGGLIEFSWADYRDSGKVLADLGLCNLLFMPR